MEDKTTYIVEVWPGQTVEVDAMDEEDAFVKVVLEQGWIGGSESTGDGIRFMAWVKEKE